MFDFTFVIFRLFRFGVGIFLFLLLTLLLLFIAVNGYLVGPQSRRRFSLLLDRFALDLGGGAFLRQFRLGFLDLRYFFDDRRLAEVVL